MTLAPDTDRIESQRLILRRIDHGDLEFFTRLHADPEVARYLLHGRPRSSEESLAWIQSIFGTYEDFARSASNQRLTRRESLLQIATLRNGRFRAG